MSECKFKEGVKVKCPSGVCEFFMEMFSCAVAMLMSFKSVFVFLLVISSPHLNVNKSL